GAAVRPRRGTGEAVHGAALEPGGERRPPDPRRLRVHGRVRDLEAVPRPEDPRDRRGNERGAAHGDRQAPRPAAILRRRSAAAPTTADLVTLEGGAPTLSKLILSAEV